MNPTTTPAQLPPTLPSLATAYRALVVGATGAIGAALVAQLQADPRCAAVCALSRRSNPAIDFAAPDSIAAAAQALRAQGPWHLIVVATGMLTGPTGGPEKRLAELNATHMAASFATNTIGSAKVGSIGDNRLGGWYSYRASKAALNMLLKTAAIEVARTHPQAVLAALHPGTVNSALSAPFRGAEIGRPPTEAARDLLAVLDTLQPADSGGFWAYDGQRLPW